MKAKKYILLVIIQAVFCTAHYLSQGYESELIGGLIRLIFDNGNDSAKDAIDSIIAQTISSSGYWKSWWLDKISLIYILIINTVIFLCWSEIILKLFPPKSQT